MDLLSAVDSASLGLSRSDLGSELRKVRLFYGEL